MNKITFGHFLYANNLPRIGETVITPSGFKVEVIAYVFDKVEGYVKIRCEDKVYEEFTWYLSQLNKCTWKGKKRYE